MKIIFLIPLVALGFLTPAYGQLLSDATGLVNRLDVQTKGHTYEVEVVSNFDITDYTFDDSENRLSLSFESGLENNLGEMIIPRALLGGNFTFYLNDKEFFPNFKSNEKISFITLNFTGMGSHSLDIFATETPESQPNTNEQNSLPTSEEPTENQEVGGCLIATATFGSELAPQVQNLRELRDNYLLKSKYGSEFMNTFNIFYYSFSPVIADYERENPILKDTITVLITPLIYNLSFLNHVSLDSEFEVVGYGVGMILLNLGLYVGAPVIVLSHINKFRKSKFR